MLCWNRLAGNRLRLTSSCLRTRKENGPDSAGPLNPTGQRGSNARPSHCERDISEGGYAASDCITLRGTLPWRIDDRVFALHGDSLTHAFSRAYMQAGIAGLCFHNVHHEAVSRLFERGLNPMQVAAISGHRTLQMHKRYTHLRAENLALLLA